MKGLKQFGTLKPKCHRMDGWMGWMVGISPDRSISRSPSGDNNRPSSVQELLSELKSLTSTPKRSNETILGLGKILQLFVSERGFCCWQRQIPARRIYASFRAAESFFNTMQRQNGGKDKDNDKDKEEDKNRLVTVSLSKLSKHV